MSEHTILDTDFICIKEQKTKLNGLYEKLSTTVKTTQQIEDTLSEIIVAEIDLDKLQKLCKMLPTDPRA